MPFLWYKRYFFGYDTVLILTVHFLLHPHVYFMSCNKNNSIPNFYNLRWNIRIEFRNFTRQSPNVLVNGKHIFLQKNKTLFTMFDTVLNLTEHFLLHPHVYLMSCNKNNSTPNFYNLRWNVIHVIEVRNFTRQNPRWAYCMSGEYFAGYIMPLHELY
jgi:hypothetical protein